MRKILLRDLLSLSLLAANIATGSTLFPGASYFNTFCVSLLASDSNQGVLHILANSQYESAKTVDLINIEFYGMDNKRARFHAPFSDLPHPVPGKTLRVMRQKILEPLAAGDEPTFNQEILIFHELKESNYSYPELTVGLVGISFLEIELVHRESALSSFTPLHSDYKQYIKNQKLISNYLLMNGISIQPFLLEFKSKNTHYISRALVLGSTLQEIKEILEAEQMTPHQYDQAKQELKSALFKANKVLNSDEFKSYCDKNKIQPKSKFTQDDFLFVNGKWMLTKY